MKTDMRQLDEKEQKLCEAQLKRHKNELEDIENDFKYNKDIIKLQNERRIHDDKWRNHIRKVKDEQDAKVFKQMKIEMENHKTHIEELTTQLKDGVKIPSIVK